MGIRGLAVLLEKLGKALVVWLFFGKTRFPKAMSHFLGICLQLGEFGMRPHPVSCPAELGLLMCLCVKQGTSESSQCGLFSFTF